MMRLIVQTILVILCAAAFQLAAAQQSDAPIQTGKTTELQKSIGKIEKEENAIIETEKIIAEVVEKSFPELRVAKISVRTFYSSSDYFRAGFLLSRFFTFRKLHFIIFVNPQIFEKNAPPEGIRAIVAHELAHAAYYRRHNRFELFGLAGLQSNSFAARFERGADLQAIKRGYGAGLKQYREWLYENIPAKKIAAKKRNYFSPAEIDLILDAVEEKPKLIDYWIKKVPRSLDEIRTTINSKAVKWNAAFNKHFSIEII